MFRCAVIRKGWNFDNQTFVYNTQLQSGRGEFQEKRARLPWKHEECIRSFHPLFHLRSLLVYSRFCWVSKSLPLCKWIDSAHTQTLVGKLWTVAFSYTAQLKILECKTRSSPRAWAFAEDSMWFQPFAIFHPHHPAPFQIEFCLNLSHPWGPESQESQSQTNEHEVWRSLTIHLLSWVELCQTRYPELWNFSAILH